MKTRTLEFLTLSLSLTTFLALGITALDLMKVLELSFDLKELSSKEIRWKIIIKSLGSLGTVFFAILIFTLFRNIRKGKVFEQSNAKALKIYGNLMILIGLACIIFINSLSLNYTIDTTRYYLIMIIGLCMNFFAYAFEIGYKLKEEQELAI